MSRKQVVVSAFAAVVVLGVVSPLFAVWPMPTYSTYPCAPVAEDDRPFGDIAVRLQLAVGPSQNTPNCLETGVHHGQGRPQGRR